MQNRHNMQFNTLNTHTVNIKIINKIELIFQTSPLIGETLSCKREPSNVVDKDAIAIMRPDSYGKDVIVGHMPENVSKCCSMFLTLPNTTIEAEVVGKTVEVAMGWRSL